MCVSNGEQLQEHFPNRISKTINGSIFRNTLKTNYNDIEGVDGLGSL